MAPSTVDLKAMNVRRILKIAGWCVGGAIAASTLAALFADLFYLQPMRNAVAHFDRGFNAITRGMDANGVVALMGEPHEVSVRDSGPGAKKCWWGDDATSGDGNYCERTYRYGVQTWILPIDWCIGFDEQGKVIAKHRFD
jgi:hypothetical protein